MIFTLSKLSLCIPSSSKPQLGCFVYLLEIQHHFNKADTLHILINLHTSLIPFTRSHITLHNYLTGPIHSQKLSLSTIYSLLCSSLRESTEATCKCIGQPNDTILPMLRRCNFCGFHNQLVVHKSFILKISLAKLLLGSTGVQDTCEWVYV